MWPTPDKATEFRISCWPLINVRRGEPRRAKILLNRKRTSYNIAIGITSKGYCHLHVIRNVEIVQTRLAELHRIY